MIPNLLWRCPLCATNDTLVQKRRLFRPLQIYCKNCQTTWQVRRIIGDDYWLEVIASPKYQEEIGKDIPLAQWYDRMKETIALTPIEDPAVKLEDHEHLYIASDRVFLTVQSNDPRFFSQKDVSSDATEMMGKRVGHGRIFLTNRRFIWQGEDGNNQSYPLEKVNSFYAAAGTVGILLYEMWLMQFRFSRAPLNWVTYFAYVGKELEATTGHVITTSRY